MLTSEAEAPDLTFRAERAAVAAALNAFCDTYLCDAPGAVGTAIRYSLLGEGKRLRQYQKKQIHHRRARPCTAHQEFEQRPGPLQKDQEGEQCRSQQRGGN